MKLLVRARVVVGLTVVLLAGTSASALARSATWEPSAVIPPQGTTWLSAFPDGSAFSYFTGDGARMLRSRDFGKTWAPAFIPDTSGTESVAFGTATRGYTIGNGLIFSTDDAAATWTRLPGPAAGPGRRFAMDLSLDAGGSTVMLGGRIVESTGACGPPSDTAPDKDRQVIFTSHDGGASWIAGEIALRDAFVWKINILDERNAVALAYDLKREDGCRGVSTRNLVFLTSDGGRAWRPVLDCGEYCTSVAMVDSNRIVAGFRDGRIARSEDAGRTFKEVTPLAGALPPPPPLQNAYWVSSLDFADCEVGYAATNGRGTFRSDDAGLTWRSEPSPQSVFGIGIGDLAVADRTHAVAGGPNLVSHRVPGDGERPIGTDKPCPRATATAPAPVAPGAPGASPGAPSGNAPPTSLAKPAAKPARLAIKSSPARLRAGRRTTVTITVTARRAGEKPIAVPGALVRVGRRSATTDRRGRVRLRLLVARGRRLQVIAQHPSYGAVTDVVRSRRRG